MPANVLITGGSGYLGGSLLAQLKQAHDLPSHGTIYAMVRSDEQAQKISELYDATPIRMDLDDEASLTQSLIDKEISVVFYLIDSRSSLQQVRLIRALQKVQQKTGIQTHLLHTTGAKMFSSHVGYPTDRVSSDVDEDLYDLQKKSKSPHPVMQTALDANCQVIEAAEAHGVRAYVFAPCIVYGEGLGFGNKISIQTVEVVKVGRALRQVIKVDEGKPIWPVCHIHDNTTLYIQLLRKILAGDDSLGYNKRGYFLASPGSVTWDDIYSAMAKALEKRGLVDDATVKQADDALLQKVTDEFGWSREMIPVMFGGQCLWTAQHGKNIGWTPKYAPEHILEAADEEVELIVRNI